MANIIFPETDIIEVVFQDNYGVNLQGTGLEQIKWQTKSYFFKKHPKGTLFKDDLVVVFCATGLQVAKVVNINCTTPKGVDVNKYVVDVVAVESYNSMIEAIAKQRIIKRQLLERKKALDEQWAFTLYAEKDPEFKKLLEALNEVGGNL